MQTSLEKEHVQEVYEAIATHFSETRYKPWPLVERHVKGFPIGSLVADVGCGNGKYLGCNPLAYCVGSDQSTNLIKICKEKGFESLVADGLHLPFRNGSFDHVICIAVIHHFSTKENRLHALEEMKRVVRIGGQVLVTAWAFEQQKKKYTEQDVMIKWHLQKRFDAASSSSDSSSPAAESTPTKVLDRYYHLFKQGELDELAKEVGGLAIVQSVWDVDNWYLVLERTA